MKNSGYYVVRSETGGWSVRTAGANRASKNFSTQTEAIDYARERAKKDHGDLYVHRPDGTVVSRSRYGNDPLPAKGG